MEPVYKASGNYYPAPNSQQQPGYWSEYTGAVTQGPGGQAVTQLSLSPQVVVTMLPPRPHPAVITDHSKSDQREPEANNNIEDSQDSSVSSSVIAGQTPGLRISDQVSASDWAETMELVPSVGPGGQHRPLLPRDGAQHQPGRVPSLPLL